MASASGWEFAVCDPGGLSTTSAERCSRVFMTTAAHRMIGVTRKRFKDWGRLDAVRPQGGGQLPGAELPFPDGGGLAAFLKLPLSAHPRRPRFRASRLLVWAPRGLGPGTGRRGRYEPQHRLGFSWGRVMCVGYPVSREGTAATRRSPRALVAPSRVEARGRWHLWARPSAPEGWAPAALVQTP